MCLAIGQLPNTEDKVARAIELDDQGECERHQVSEHATLGPVADEEMLARFVFSPENLATGQLPFHFNETVFGDVFRRGSSIQRLTGDWPQCSAQIHNAGEQLATARRLGNEQRRPKPDTKYLGVVHVTAAELRAAQLEAKFRHNRVRVYGTALKDDETHGDVMADSRDLATKADRQLKKDFQFLLMRIAEVRGLFKSPYLPSDDTDILSIDILVRA